MNMRVNIDREELRRRYVDEGQTLVAIAAQLGCSAATVSNMLRRDGIPRRRGYFPLRDIPREILVQLYSIERLPIKQIIIRLGVSAGTISNRRKAYGIPARPRANIPQKS
jgi:DNA-binding Lrp family transcriptional regulator